MDFTKALPVSQWEPADWNNYTASLRAARLSEEPDPRPITDVLLKYLTARRVPLSVCNILSIREATQLLDRMLREEPRSPDIVLRRKEINRKTATHKPHHKQILSIVRRQNKYGVDGDKVYSRTELEEMTRGQITELGNSLFDLYKGREYHDKPAGADPWIAGVGGGFRSKHGPYVPPAEQVASIEDRKAPETATGIAAQGATGKISQDDLWPSPSSTTKDSSNSQSCHVFPMPMAATILHCRNWSFDDWAMLIREADDYAAAKGQASREPMPQQELVDLIEWGCPKYVARHLTFSQGMYAWGCYRAASQDASGKAGYFDKAAA